MADNRERARALMLAVGRIDDEPQRSIADTIAVEEKVLMVLTAALDAAFSRGSASIAALTEGVVDAARRWQSARQTVVTASLDGGSLPAGYVTVLADAECNLRDAVAALAAIPAPPAPLKERGEATS